MKEESSSSPVFAEVSGSSLVDSGGIYFYPGGGATWSSNYGAFYADKNADILRMISLGTYFKPGYSYTQSEVQSLLNAYRSSGVTGQTPAEQISGVPYTEAEKAAQSAFNNDIAYMVRELQNNTYSSAKLEGIFDSIRGELAAIKDTDARQDADIERLMKNVNNLASAPPGVTQEDLHELEIRINNHSTANNNRFTAINTRLDDPVKGLDAINAGLAKAYQDHLFQNELIGDLADTVAENSRQDLERAKGGSFWDQLKAAFSGFASGGMIGVLIIILVLILIVRGGGSKTVLARSI